jgi:hypothetical protein
MKTALSTCLLTAAICCIGITADAMSLRCDVCDEKLGRQQWTYDEQTVCSQHCVDALRPVCSICKNVIHGKYSESDGKIFCSTTCFQTTVPKCEICKRPIEKGFSITRHNYCERCVEKQPDCFSCGLPSSYPTHLKDDRVICNGCMRWAVVTQNMAQRNYERAQRQLEAWTSLKIATVPELVLVDQDEMKQISKELRKTESPVSLRGLYSRQLMMTRQGLFGTWKEDPAMAQEKIYIVDHLSDTVFRVAATHELMHDMIHEHFPRLKEAPLWVHEGICQQAAAELCRRRNYGDILFGITESPDPDYGDGYRYINRLMGFEGWNALRRWMETVDVTALPETAP